MAKRENLRGQVFKLVRLANEVQDVALQFQAMGQTSAAELLQVSANNIFDVLKTLHFKSRGENVKASTSHTNQGALKLE